MSIFPGAIPPAGSAVPSDTLAAAGHTALHNTSYDEIRALATKVGTGASTPTANKFLRGNGVGTSAWAQVDLTTDVTGVLPVGSGGIGQNTLTGLTLPSAILSASPTLTTPIITDLTNADHTHATNAQGGQLSTSALSANTVAVSRLAAVETTDLFDGSAITASTWTDFVANKNFTVDNANSIIIIWVSAGMLIGSSSTTPDTASRLIIDSAGTPITRYLGASRNTVAGQFTNAFSGAGAVIITGLAAGTHTVKSQVYSSGANTTMYLRTSSVPDQEFFTTNVLELKK